MNKTGKKSYNKNIPYSGGARILYLEGRLVARNFTEGPIHIIYNTQNKV